MRWNYQSGRSLTDICSHDEGMPSKDVVLKWCIEAENALAEAKEGEDLSENPYLTFYHRYTQARARQSDALMDETVAIADCEDSDLIEQFTKDGTPYMAPNPTKVKRDALRIDSRQKYAAMTRPDKYGRIPTVHINQDNRKVVTHNTSITTVVQRAEDKTRGLPGLTLVQENDAD